MSDQTNKNSLELLFEQFNQTSKSQASAINELTKVTVSLLEIIDNKPIKMLELLETHGNNLKDLVRELKYIEESNIEFSRRIEDIYKFNLEEVKPHLQKISDIKNDSTKITKYSWKFIVTTVFLSGIGLTLIGLLFKGALLLNQVLSIAGEQVIP